MTITEDKKSAKSPKTPKAPKEPKLEKPKLIQPAPPKEEEDEDNGSGMLLPFVYICKNTHIHGIELIESDDNTRILLSSGGYLKVELKNKPSRWHSGWLHYNRHEWTTDLDAAVAYLRYQQALHIQRAKKALAKLEKGFASEPVIAKKATR